MRIRGLHLEDFRDNNDNKNNSNNKRKNKKDEANYIKKEKVKKNSQKPY